MLSFSAFALFAYLGGSPIVFEEQFKLTPGQYAIAFGTVAASYIVCSQLNMRLIGRWDLNGTLTRVSTLYLLMAGCVLALVLLGAGPVWLGISLALTQGLTGFLNPTAMVGALTHHGAHAGSASALLGTMQFFIGASSGFLVGYLTDGTALPMAGLILAGAVLVKIADLCRPRETRAVLQACGE
jgi:DHA1 family bicyclomycin/chloramphenicol resistance-like MFS transporter